VLFCGYYLVTNLVTDCMCVIKEGNCNFGFSTECLNGDVVVVIDHRESYVMHGSSVSMSCYFSRAPVEKEEYRT
jgi:hypothetical protein